MGGRGGGLQEAPGRYLMLVPKVAVQFFRVLGLVVAELAFVRFQFIVLFYVLLEALVAGAGEGTLITAENHSLQVFRQLGTAHLDGDDSLFCGDKTDGKMGSFAGVKPTLLPWQVGGNPASPPASQGSVGSGLQGAQ